MYEVVCKKIVDVSVMVCSKQWKMVHDKVACDKVVCAKDGVCVCVTKDGVWQSWSKLCDKDGVWQWCVLKMVWDKEPAQCHKCHAGQAKQRWMSPSATHATRKEGRCRQDSPSATRATQTEAATTGPKRATRASPVPQVTRLPHKVKIDVAKYHACHTEWRRMSPSAMPGTRKEGGRLPRKQRQRPRDPSAPPEPARAVESATLATQSAGRCRQVRRLPRKVPVDVAKRQACQANRREDNSAKREPSAPPEPAQRHKCHACHAKCRSMSSRTTPARQSEGRCDQVPRLPRKPPRQQRRQTGTKRATRASPGARQGREVVNTTTIENNTALSKSSLRRAFCKKLDSAAWLAARYAHRVEKVEKKKSKNGRFE